MKNDFIKVRQQLEEHLTAINENTSEIQALFDYLQDIETKIDRLTQRLDQLQLGQEKQVEKKMITSLNQIEKKVFLALYTEEIPVSHKEIAVKANLPLALIPECISSLCDKGVPFQRSFYNDTLFLKLDPRFKEAQAKENLVNLSLQSFID